MEPKWRCWKHRSGNWWLYQNYRGAPIYEFRHWEDAMRALYPRPVELDTSNWNPKLKALYGL